MSSAQGNANNLLSNPTPYLLTKEIQDLYVRKNFQNLVAYFAAQNQLVNFNFFELEITSATTAAETLNHNLNYVPKDIIVTQITGSGTIQFLYGSFNSTSISYQATGPCRVRFFVGTYFNDSSTVTAQSTDIQSETATPLTASSNTTVSATGSYQALGTEYLILMTTTGTGATKNATVRTPTAPTKGMVLRVQKVDNNTHPVIIAVASSLTQASQIVPPGAASIQLTAQWSCVEMIYDGTNWRVYNKWSGS